MLFVSEPLQEVSPREPLWSKAEMMDVKNVLIVY